MDEGPAASGWGLLAFCQTKLNTYQAPVTEAVTHQPLSRQHNLLCDKVLGTSGG